MKWSFGIGKKQPDISKAAVNPLDVRAAPVDPTLEAAARETSERIRETAKHINKLSADIIQMTDDLVGLFKDSPNEKPPR